MNNLSTIMEIFSSLHMIDTGPEMTGLSPMESSLSRSLHTGTDNQANSEAGLEDDAGKASPEAGVQWTHAGCHPGSWRPVSRVRSGGNLGTDELDTQLRSSLN